MFALNDAQIDWEKPASLKTGDVSEDVLFTAVGKAFVGFTDIVSTEISQEGYGSSWCEL